MVEGAWFLSHPLGLVRGTLETPAEALLTAMWVAPSRRGHGVGGLLVGAVAGWARGQGAVRLLARVFDDNAPAVALWTATGFVPGGDVQVSRRDPSRTWTTWVRPLASGRG